MATFAQECLIIICVHDQRLLLCSIHYTVYSSWIREDKQCAWAAAAHPFQTWGLDLQTLIISIQYTGKMIYTLHI